MSRWLLDKYVPVGFGKLSGLRVLSAPPPSVLPVTRVFACTPALSKLSNVSILKRLCGLLVFLAGFRLWLLLDLACE